MVKFEMFVLADLLKWCKAGEEQGVRSRLRDVAGYMKVSKQELVGVIGEVVRVLACTCADGPMYDAMVTAQWEIV